MKSIIYRWTLAVVLWLSAFPAEAAFRYRLTLDGKPGSELIALSDRARARRERQGIALDSLDFAVAPAYVQALTEAGLHVCARSRWLNTVVVMRADGAAVDTSVWETLSFVKEIQLVASTEAGMSPSRRRSKRVAVEATAAGATDDFRAPVRQVNGQALLDAGHRGGGMLVAILDAGFTGIDKFDWLRRRVVGCRDMYAPGDTAALYAADVHGAHVLSIMASDSSHGIWGTAAEADYYLVRCEYSPSESPYEEDQWVAAAELADSIGADLINSSLGYYSFDNPSGDHAVADLGAASTFITRGAECAAAKGMVVCCAAGNEANSAWQRLIFPGDAASVLTVGACTDAGTASSFTSFGFLEPYVKPDVACRGTGAYVLDCTTGAVARGSGTSYATPLLCGLATALWAAAPSLTAAEVREVIRASASLRNAPDVRLGYGLPDFAAALEAALRLAESKTSAIDAAPRLAPQESETGINVGIYDLQGRRLTARPSRGLYIEDGKLHNAK